VARRGRDVATRAELVASDLPRARLSAERLAPSRQIVISALLRETPLEIPTWLPLRWPLVVWEVAVHAQWLYRSVRGTETPAAERRRASAAAQWLAARSTPGTTLVALTHGVFRRLVARELAAGGWRPEPGRRSYANWSAWGFRRDARLTASER
jgi:hypothetical protein